ncbi:catechol 2,3-dioxygenase-like lactoylglutathione lyase family enzyme [Labedaea rhizosphaerae]|uniref:Catechol 2,3-dioxygenase-like lactoylglutathione lyase family enzyme n=2 Tax=Labedaea rhizosphaerae TaxID=598644 RepID=A0A4R6SC98_LABRH|nr:catechol 2,3-dioxygenase-like lactoylglutathione lyase family enzyme [Labedaea rhizosphaerae]
MGVRSMDHVNITVSDLDAAIAFFQDIGLELEGGKMAVEGEWVENIIALDGVREDIAMLRTPDGSKVELCQFHTPVDDREADAAPANRLGLRSVAFVVDDAQAVVDELGRKGYGLVGKLQNFEDMFLIGYVRGPDGIIVSINQEL